MDTNTCGVAKPTWMMICEAKSAPPARTKEVGVPFMRKLRFILKVSLGLEDDC